MTVKDADHAREAMKKSPYRSCEVFYPLGLCRDGVEIIDSPGSTPTNCASGLPSIISPAWTRCCSC